MSTRAQTPSLRAKQALQRVVSEKVESADPAKLTRHQMTARERLANGETNGSVNHHVVAKAIRFLPGGRESLIGHIQRAKRNGDPDAVAWWDIYADLAPSHQSRVDLDDVCEAAGVAPKRLMSMVVSEAIQIGNDVAEYIAAVANPEIVHQTVKSAKRIGGQHAAIALKDREILLGHSGFIKQRAPGIGVTVNANAAAAAHSQVVSQPSVPSFRESVSGAAHGREQVQQEIIEADVTAFEADEAE